MGRNSDSRSHSRSRKKSKKTSKKKYKRYSRSRSRSRSHSRSSRSSSADRQRRRSRRERSRDRYYSKDHYYQDKGETDFDYYKPSNEPSQWLFISDIEDDVTQKILENQFQEISIQAGTSLPDEIRVVNYLKQVYIQYPSSQIAGKILHHLKGKMEVQNKVYKIDYYMTEAQKLQQSQMIPAYLDNTQDWMCEKCDYKNFAKRSKCHKCDRPKSQVCKGLINAPSQQQGKQGQVHYEQQNTSLMVRGQVMTKVTEAQILDVFQKFAAVKDIRMVKYKNSGAQRDFAFVEFFTQDEAEKVLKNTEKNLLILGQEVNVFLSRAKNESNQNSQSSQSVGNSSNMLNMQHQQQLQLYNYYQMAQQQNPSISENQQQQQQQQPQQQQQQQKQQQQQQHQQSKQQQKQQEKGPSQKDMKNALLELEQHSMNLNSELNVKEAKQNELTEQQLKQRQQAREIKEQQLEKQKREANKVKKAEMELKKWEKQLQIQQQQEMMKGQDQEKGQVLQSEQTKGGDSILQEKPLIIICSICKKKFQTEEALKLHEKLSEIHKKNIKQIELSS